MTDHDLASLPFLRSLPREALAALDPHVTRVDLAPNVTVLREGDAAASMFFLARGTVAITRGERNERIGSLTGPTLFGEMALVATTPRLATVVTDTPCVVFEISRDAIFALAGSFPAVRDTIIQFHRDRLMQNVLVSNPLFTPLGEPNQRHMAASFVTKAVAAGQVLLQEGQPGIGLYVLLRGRCQVLHAGTPGHAEVEVSQLSEGDVFGEISIVLFDRNCTATVRTASDCVVLFLAREIFQATVMSNPAAREAMMKLALKRLRNTAEVKAQRAYFV
jgi:cAMP-dependent protein kinase regulator